MNETGAFGYYLAAKDGNGTQVPEEDWKSSSKVEILDVWENMASTKAVMHDYVNYLHLNKFNGKWVIVNVLWDTSSLYEAD